MYERIFYPFNVTPTFVLSELQVEFIKLQSNDTLKAIYLNKSLLKLLCAQVSMEEFPNLELTLLNGHQFSEARTYANNSF